MKYNNYTEAQRLKYVAPILLMEIHEGVTGDAASTMVAHKRIKKLKAATTLGATDIHEAIDMAMTTEPVALVGYPIPESPT